MRVKHLVTKFPDGDTPVERMERLAQSIKDLAGDLQAAIATLKEETDAERTARAQALYRP
jgi:hypothetical protein